MVIVYTKFYTCRNVFDLIFHHSNHYGFHSDRLGLHHSTLSMTTQNNKTEKNSSKISVQQILSCPVPHMWSESPTCPLDVAGVFLSPTYRIFWHQQVATDPVRPSGLTGRTNCPRNQLINVDRKWDSDCPLNKEEGIRAALCAISACVRRACSHRDGKWQSLH